MHSVLNYTPPPLLREIILVDDHSSFAENGAGGLLDDHVRALPKVKILRLPERMGIVRARIAGAKAASAKTLVILDSHIEVNPGWLEPQLQRVQESPESIVFPQILGLDARTLETRPAFGIGCYLSTRWVVVEQASLTGKVTSAQAVASPTLAGGLFAVNREFFWHIGGYDEEFVAWGAENVELSFRTWMCGGRVECAPCARTYHIYRKGGAGYKNPRGALWRNRKRTARLWMQQHFQLASPMIDLSANRPDSSLMPDTRANPDAQLGSFTQMLDLQSRLQCKPFSWYLENVEPDHDAKSLDQVLSLGRVRWSAQNRPSGTDSFNQSLSLAAKEPDSGLCLDLAGRRTADNPVKLSPCHRAGKVGGNQGFYISL